MKTVNFIIAFFSKKDDKSNSFSSNTMNCVKGGRYNDCPLPSVATHQW